MAIAAHFDSEGLPTLARHFYKQANEEREHAMRFVKYTLDADGRVAIPAIPAPRSTFAHRRFCPRAPDRRQWRAPLPARRPAGCPAWDDSNSPR